jgi:hypothetical protein
MTRARHAIAVVLVATALCADRSTVSAAPAGTTGNEPLAASQAQSSSSFAARFVNRLTAGLRRAVPGFAIVYQARQDQPAVSSVAFAAPADHPTPHHQPTSPFQFRLPPPLL